MDFVCELDGLDVDSCTSPMTYSDLPVDEHTFAVYATDGGTAGLPTPSRGPCCRPAGPVAEREAEQPAGRPTGRTHPPRRPPSPRRVTGLT